MRTTVTLDPDVAALIDSERARTGASFREAINRLVRRGARGPAPQPVPLPTLPGRPAIDLGDTSAVLAALDDERRAQRDLP
ncbi:MAG: ribbon-helix-helix protein, CopG family [Gaiellales bacterium]